MAKASKPSVKRPVRCYLCGHQFEVSARTMSTACGRCNKAIIIEDVVVKSYVPVNDLQTCGKIRIMKRGRVAAKRIQSGDGIVCEGFMEGEIVTDGNVELGPKATWKGKLLQSRALAVADGAKLMGVINVPWARPKLKRPGGSNGESAKRSSTTTANRNGSTPTTERSGEVTTPNRSAPATSAKAAGSAATVKRAATATVTKRSAGGGVTQRTASKKTAKRPATKKKTTAKAAGKKTATKKAATKKKKTAKKTTAKKTTAKKKTKKETKKKKKKTTRRR